ncbi:MAG: glycine cleavage system protein R [Thiohalomonadales bacterium]
MDDFLVLTAVGNDRPGIVDKLSMTILENGCNIVDCRMTVLGGEFAVMLLISGKWNSLVKLEDGLSKLEQELVLRITSTRTKQGASAHNLMPYNVEVVAIDHPGIVYQIASFFSAREINIRELNTTSYAAAHTGTEMFSMLMTVDISSDIRIASLREEFIEFCDELNVDAVLEPKNI